MHDHHTHYSHAHNHTHDETAGTAALRTLQTMLEHWIEHSDSHKESYQAWAAKASEVGEEEIAKEIYLAINASEAVKSHLKRAKAILAAKLVLIK
jgi:hypothetical protein